MLILILITLVLVLALVPVRARVLVRAARVRVPGDYAVSTRLLRGELHLPHQYCYDYAASSFRLFIICVSFFFSVVSPRAVLTTLPLFLLVPVIVDVVMRARAYAYGYSSGRARVCDRV